MTEADRMDYGVVVVGGGLAGHCAALAAAEAGARVLLVEKTAAIGGSTVHSGGSFAFGGTVDQESAGIEDSPALLRADLEKAGKGHADPALLDVYVERQLDVLAWLKRHGVEILRVSLSSSQSAPRSHSVDSTQMMRALGAAVEANPAIDVRLETAASQLVSDAGRIVGVALETGGRGWMASGSVVLATGGFVRNPEMIGQYAPQLAGISGMGGIGNEGDGIALGRSVGAGLRDMSFLKGTFGAVLDRYPETRTGPDTTLLMTMYRGGIIVNLDAERFVDESQSYKLIGDACLQQRDFVGIQIFDQAIMDQSVETPLLNNFLGAYKRGFARRGGTVRELADALGLDPDALERTVTTYNVGVAAGADPAFGRRTLSSTFGVPPALTHPPYYGVPCTTALIATYCGLSVSPQMEVTRDDGTAIRGLYAAGEVVGGFHGASYMSGASLGKSAIFGWVAGANGAKQALAAAG